MARQIPARKDAKEALLGGAILEFMSLVWSLDHALQTRSKHMQRVLGVTGPQRLVIRLIGKKPGVVAGELSSALRVHPSTLTGILRRLEAGGFLVRKVDAEDRRRARFALTKEGKRIDAHKAETVEASIRRALNRMSQGDEAAAKRIFGVLTDELERT
jgi:MarR family transcriptional regulator, organic hydroperoxide resistance regulator